MSGFSLNIADGSSAPQAAKATTSLLPLHTLPPAKPKTTPVKPAKPASTTAAKAPAPAPVPVIVGKRSRAKQASAAPAAAVPGTPGAAATSSKPRAEPGTRKRPRRADSVKTGVIAAGGADMAAQAAELVDAARQQIAHTWDDLNLPARLTAHVTGHGNTDLGLAKPTAVQCFAVPALARGSPVLAKAETGSGKTLAFGIPLLAALLSKTFKRESGTHALVLSPTRELARQTLDVLTQLAAPWPHIVVGGLSGGDKRKSEKARLRKGVTIVVATPGRLLDHVRNTTAFSLQAVSWLILDEADRLLDLGFEPQVAAVVAALHGQKLPPSEAPPAEQPKVQPVPAGMALAMVTATATARVRALAYALSQGPVLFIDADKQRMGALSDGGACKLARIHTERAAGTAAASGTTTAADTATEPESALQAGEDAGPEASAGPAGGAGGSMAAMPAQLLQYYCIVPIKWRLPSMLGMIRERLQSGSAAKILIFVGTCDGVDLHYLVAAAAWHALVQGQVRSEDALLSAAGMPPVLPAGVEHPGPDSPLLLRLHGNMPASERAATLRALRTSRQAVCIATDVAARGLDVSGLDFILQVDAPTEAAEYVHRAGRTARAGAGGASCIFLQPHEEGFLQVLRQHGMKRLRQITTVKALAALASCEPPLRMLGIADLPKRGRGVRTSLEDEDDDSAAGSDAEDDDNKHRHGSQGQAVVRPRGTGTLRRICDLDLEAAQSEDVAVVRGAAETAARAWSVWAEELSARYPAVLHTAVEAYRSFVRAYATHAKPLKPFFHPRALHLGHTAKALALGAPPSSLSSGVTATPAKPKQRASDLMRARARALAKRGAASEFAS